MEVYHESRYLDQMRRRMHAPITVGFFLNGNGTPPPRPHAGLTCRHCGGPVLRGWSAAVPRGAACAMCARPA